MSESWTRDSTFFISSSLLIVYEGYEVNDFSGLNHSSSAIQTEKESTNSSFVNDVVAHTSEVCYNADTSNSSTDYNLSVQEEISQATLHRGFGEAAARGAKNAAFFYPPRFVAINYFSFIYRPIVDLVDNFLQEKERKSKRTEKKRKRIIGRFVSIPFRFEENIFYCSHNKRFLFQTCYS